MTDEEATHEAALAGLHDTTLAVRALIFASQDLTVRMAQRMETNVSDMRAILLLAERGPMGAAELARHLGVSSAAATILVDRLERAGHMERVRDTVDRRRVRVTETLLARTTALRAWLPVIQAMDEVCRSLPEADQAVAHDLLRRLADVMTGGGAPASPGRPAVR